MIFLPEVTAFLLFARLRFSLGFLASRANDIFSLWQMHIKRNVGLGWTALLSESHSIGHAALVPNGCFQSVQVWRRCCFRANIAP
jgi:hypothetical protein